MENPLKTEDGERISSYACAAETADAEFLFSKAQYYCNTGRNQKQQDVIAYHVRQSFKPGEITAEDANRIGYELAMRFTKGYGSPRILKSGQTVTEIFPDLQIITPEIDVIFAIPLCLG